MTSFVREHRDRPPAPQANGQQVTGTGTVTAQVGAAATAGVLGTKTVTKKTVHKKAVVKKATVHKTKAVKAAKHTKAKKVTKKAKPAKPVVSGAHFTG